MNKLNSFFSVLVFTLSVFANSFVYANEEPLNAESSISNLDVGHQRTIFGYVGEWLDYQDLSNLVTAASASRHLAPLASLPTLVGEITSRLAGRTDEVQRRFFLKMLGDVSSIPANASHELCALSFFNRAQLDQSQANYLLELASLNGYQKIVDGLIKDFAFGPEHYGTAFGAALARGQFGVAYKLLPNDPKIYAALSAFLAFVYFTH